MARSSLALARLPPSDEIERRSDARKLAQFLRLVVDNDRKARRRDRPAAKLVNRAATQIVGARFEEGLALCEQAIKIDAEDSYAHGFRANALIGLGRYTDALEATDRALAHDPGNIESDLQGYVFSLRGSALVALRRHEEGLACANRAVALVPDVSHVHTLRADAFLWLGRSVEALNEAEQALAIDQKDGSAHNQCYDQ